LIWGMVPNAIIIAGGILFQSQLTLLIFRDTIYQYLFVGALWLMVGYSLHTVLYAFYRGQNRMGQANALQLVIVALGPLLVALGFAQTGRADLIIWLQAVLTGCTVFLVGAHLFRAVVRSGRQLALSASLRQLMHYGLPRVPGGFALAGLFAIGPFLAPYFGSLKDAGYLTTGQSVLPLMQGGMVAFGLVALPRLAKMATDGQVEAITRTIRSVIALVLHIGLFLTLQGVLWADEVVMVLLGPQYQEAIPIMRVVLVSLVPYLSYVMLRSVVDAVDDRAINTMNLFIALAVAAVTGLLASLAGLGILGLAAGCSLGFVALGTTTVLHLARAYRLEWRTFDLAPILLINFGFLLLGLLVKIVLEKNLEGWPLLGGTLIAVCGMSGLYAFALWRLNVIWLGEFTRRLVVHREA